ncbi:MAG: gluconate 2-dehydrogenase subunit 3 family protein, partial [Bryobacteraceae bacterium]
FFTSAEFPVALRLIHLMLGEVTDGSRVSQEVAEWLDLYFASAEPVQEAEMHLDPLHRALAAAVYGSAAMQTGAKAKPAAIGRKGIQWVLHAARTRYAKEFLSLGVEQQTAILHSISDETPDQPENSGTRFFTLLKAETIRGFYTSRMGLQELNFKGNAFYAQSPGCNSK